MTVAFLGWLVAEELERCLGIPPVEVGAFQMSLDRLGYFAPSRSLWIGPSRVPEPLQALERDLWARLTRLGFERERRLFRPHVTLARRCRAVDLPIKPVPWTVDELVLLESVSESNASRYVPLGRWTL